jgi:bleomycin hydrolase
MKRVSIIMTVVLFLSVTVKAQNDGSISSDMLQQMRQELQSGDLRARINALSNNDINELVLSRQHLGKIDPHFAVRLDVRGITDQESTGRCWLFTGLNMIRLKVIEKYDLKSFEFSENYLFFYDQLEKANLFLQSIIDSRDLALDSRRVEWLLKHPIGDGGVWNMVSDLVEKYGLVPSDVMPETHNSNNTRDMRSVLRRKLRENALALRTLNENGTAVEELKNQKNEMLDDIYKILVLNLGEPPQVFEWRYENSKGELSEYKTWTPHSFYKDFVSEKLNHYILLMNDPSRPYYRTYEIEQDRNMYEKPNWTYVNLPVDEIKAFAKRSLVNGEPLYFSCDVGKQLNRDAGILSLENYDYESFYGLNFGMDKRQRILSFESGSSHGMALVGVDTTALGVTTKWLLENSWGEKSGHKGFLIMTDDWFSEYMFRLVVPAQFVSKQVIDIANQKAIVLPPWDPMYAPLYQ